MCDYQRFICLAVRQCGKSTAYTVFALWYAIGNRDKSILICANKFKTAKDILQRIKLAYEELPLWLKPGIVEWNASSIKFDNGCKITAEATSGSSGRGGSINVLILDEFAFLKNSLEQEFLQSVFPVVSSSKTSKIIVVSTPNGMGNEFYRTWNRAQLNLNEEVNPNLKWQCIKIDWWEVPGRDENWKKQQLETFNGDLNKFLQEYGNSFLGSAETLINPDVIKRIKDNFINSALKPYDIQLHKDFPKTTIKIYEPPQDGHAYIIGADASLGAKSDYHSMVIYDITNTYDIQQVAGFYENDVPPKTFAYMLAKAGALYNGAYVVMENNGCSQVALDALWRDFDYDNIINEGGNPKTNIGIHSNYERKTIACLTFKSFLEDELRKFKINDGRLISEMEKFERKNRTGKMPSYEAADGHDDYMLGAIWGIFPIQMNIIENYYDIRKTIVNKLGEQIPLYILPFESDIIDKSKYLKDLDEKFELFNNEYEKQLNEMTNTVSKKDEIESFISLNGLNQVSNEEEPEDSRERMTEDDKFHFFAGMN